MNFADQAAEGMTDYQRVELSEDARTAAEEIVAHWEDETGLLTGHRAEKWTDLNPTEEDWNELRGRTVANIERAIVSMRQA